MSRLWRCPDCDYEDTYEGDLEPVPCGVTKRLMEKWRRDPDAAVAEWRRDEKEGAK